MDSAVKILQLLHWPLSLLISQLAAHWCEDLHAVLNPPTQATFLRDPSWGECLQAPGCVCLAQSSEWNWTGGGRVQIEEGEGERPSYISLLVVPWRKRLCVESVIFPCQSLCLCAWPSNTVWCPTFTMEEQPFIELNVEQCSVCLSPVVFLSSCYIVLLLLVRADISREGLYNIAGNLKSRGTFRTSIVYSSTINCWSLGCIKV